MPKMVTDGAILQCSHGDVPCKLKATHNRNVQADDKPAATIHDCTPGVNLTTFGTCKTTGSPCAPAPVGNWFSGSDRQVLVNDILVLMTKDTLPCPTGPGMIKIVNPGQFRMVQDE